MTRRAGGGHLNDPSGAFSVAIGLRRLPEDRPWGFKTQGRFDTAFRGACVSGYIS